MVWKRRWVHLVVGLVLAVSLMPGAAGPVWAAGDLRHTAEAEEATTDMELVLLRDDGRIHVEDPYVKAGYLTVTFDSDQAGWERVRAGDFDGLSRWTTF